MNRLLTCCLAALHSSLASTAHAQDSVAPSSRVVGGIVATAGPPPSLRIDGKKQDSERWGAPVLLGVTTSYVQHIAPHFGMEVLGMVAPTSTRWSEMRGESRTRADLAFGPVFALSVRRSPTLRLEWRVAAPLGYTFAWFSPGKSRAIKESYSLGGGLNFRLKTGLDFAIKVHQTICFDLGYVLHATWVDRRASVVGQAVGDQRLIADPPLQGNQRYQYVEHAIFIGGGYAYRF